MGEPDPRIVATDFYSQHYHAIRPSSHPDMNRTEIGDKENQVCRFCRKSKPEVSFRSDAHAIPESLGNKSLFANYECDRCNQFFGRGIENDFGTWSNIKRTLAGISGKNGVPTVKGVGREPGWRVENESDHIKIKRYGNAPDYVLEKNRFQFEVKQGAYTPVAVLKTFVRIGLTLMPVEELPNFSEALDWIQEEDHTKSRVEKCPVIQTFLPGVKLDRTLAFPANTQGRCHECPVCLSDPRLRLRDVSGLPPVLAGPFHQWPESNASTISDTGWYRSGIVQGGACGGAGLVWAREGQRRAGSDCV